MAAGLSATIPPCLKLRSWNASAAAGRCSAVFRSRCATASRCALPAPTAAARRALRRARRGGLELCRGADRPAPGRRRQHRLHHAPAERARRGGAADPVLMLTAAGILIRRDLLLALRRRGDVATALLFFIIV